MPRDFSRAQLSLRIRNDRSALVPARTGGTRVPERRGPGRWGGVQGFLCTSRLASEYPLLPYETPAVSKTLPPYRVNDNRWTTIARIYGLRRSFSGSNPTAANGKRG